MRVSPSMLRVLFEISEQKVGWGIHHRATIWALMARNLILSPVACGGNPHGALTKAGREYLAACASGVGGPQCIHGRPLPGWCDDCQDKGHPT